MQSICVFCGSSHGVRAQYTASARELGQLLAERGITLVYGGGRVGLMGVLADAVLAAKGRVIGVIPEFLWQREVGHTGLSELHIVHSMHERKALMADLSDAFIALPGGVGTLEEFFEIWTWGVLGLHAKPFGILNVEGFYSALVQHIDRMVTEGFLPEQFRDLVLIETDPAHLLARVSAHKPARVKQVIDVDEI
jgi:uncharacterized protein (TIGR00730 family)